MGIVRTDERQRMELEEFQCMLLSCAGRHGKKGEEDTRDVRAVTKGENDDGEQKLVCVTSGVSYLGLAIVNQLLLRGYSVRVIVHNEEDVEKLRKMESTSNNIWVVMAKLTEVESLSEVFDGCRGVFHTAAFVDPSGLSGYSKSMAEIEVKASENVMEACARTPSVRKCVLTSSLLACVWRDSSLGDLSPVINHDCWSDESLCMDKKLWYALGKLRAEKTAWRIAEERGLKLATICPALITGPAFCHRNPTPTIAYLKGAQEMYAAGVLATVDVISLAEAHVCVFEELNKTAFGRYICFDQVIGSEDEVEKLAQETGMTMNRIAGNAPNNFPTRIELSNMKLSRLMSRTLRCYNEY